MQAPLRIGDAHPVQPAHRFGHRITPREPLVGDERFSHQSQGFTASDGEAGCDHGLGGAFRRVEMDGQVADIEQGRIHRGPPGQR